VSAPLDAGRRRLLLAAVGLAASVAIGPGAIGLVLDRLDAAERVSTALRKLVPHRESAADLGRAYLETAAAEGSAMRLASLIIGGTSVAPGREAARVASNIRADFAAGRVVTVRGWIVSRTEARLFALCAIG
jgi:hypothetical protein